MSRWLNKVGNQTSGPMAPMAEMRPTEFSPNDAQSNPNARS